MRSHWRLIGASLAIGLAGCQLSEPAVVPPESTYSSLRAAVVVNGVNETTDVAHVSPEFFNAQGLQPWLGRFFIPDEYRPGGTAVAVLSHPYWTERFKAEPGVLGTRVVVEGKPTVIIGVAPTWLKPAKPASLWIPRMSGAT